MPLSRTYGVATFYNFFSLKPKGEHTCVVCLGTACYVKGSGTLLKALEAAEGIRAGETTRDDKLSLVTARCIGACGLAPAVVFDGETVGKVSPHAAFERVARWRSGDRVRMSSEARRDLAERELAVEATKRAGWRCVRRPAACPPARPRARGLRKEPRRGRPGDEVELFGTGCLGLCHAGPIVQVEPQGGEPLLDEHMDAVGATEVVAEHVAQGKVVTGRLAEGQQAFFTRQQRIVLENSGRIDPERIESYIAAGGYAALQQALTEMTPDEVVEEIIAQRPARPRRRRLSDRLKWSTVAKTRRASKYVICNADEGDPGAFMDRSVLEGDPHRVLEGMAIAGYAVGADQGFIYVRGEYPLAISAAEDGHQAGRTRAAAGQQHLRHRRFNFNIDIRIGAGAFVCGEETALMASIEGKRGTPRPRPPYPGGSGPVGLARR